MPSFKDLFAHPPSMQFPKDPYAHPHLSTLLTIRLAHTLWHLDAACRKGCWLSLSLRVAGAGLGGCGSTHTSRRSLFRLSLVSSLTEFPASNCSREAARSLFSPFRFVSNYMVISKLCFIITNIKMFSESFIFLFTSMARGTCAALAHCCNQAPIQACCSLNFLLVTQ